jgi:mutator protein MutT
MRHCACAILFDGGRILLGRRSPHRRSYANRWDVIGGHVELGETIEEALVRELREEIGVVPTIYERIGSIVDRSLEARGDATYHMFVVTSWTGGPPAMQDNEHAMLEWFSVKAACALPDLALPEYREIFRRLETHRQSLAVSISARAQDDQAFIDAISDRGDE